MFPLTLDADTTLRLLTPDDTDALIALVQRNRAHLDPWLRWSARVQTVDNARAYLIRWQERHAEGDGFHAGLWLGGELAGGVVCHGIDRMSHKTEIGYWLGAEYTGRGLVTRACRAVLDHLFAAEKMHRVEIQCAVDNAASRAVAERLGFTFEGILRESEWITDAFRDHTMYSLLDREWEAANAGQ